MDDNVFSCFSDLLTFSGQIQICTKNDLQIHK